MLLLILKVLTIIVVSAAAEIWVTNGSVRSMLVININGKINLIVTFSVLLLNSSICEYHKCYIWLKLDFRLHLSPILVEKEKNNIISLLVI